MTIRPCNFQRSLCQGLGYYGANFAVSCRRTVPPYALLRVDEYSIRALSPNNRSAPRIGRRWGRNSMLSSAYPDSSIRWLELGRFVPVAPPHRRLTNLKCIEFHLANVGLKLANVLHLDMPVNRGPTHDRIGTWLAHLMTKLTERRAKWQ